MLILNLMNCFFVNQILTQNYERFIPKEKTIIVSQKQNKFLIFVDILFSLFIDDIRLPNQERSLILFRLLKDSTRKDDNKKKKRTYHFV